MNEENEGGPPNLNENVLSGALLVELVVFSASCDLRASWKKFSFGAVRVTAGSAEVAVAAGATGAAGATATGGANTADGAAGVVKVAATAGGF